ncbi:MAG TPA: ketol-acid reductoisomerase [Kofleriaceae bacterium]|nr:ketol-acid reductoisomerase [Kofleriaceae bacterium]
MPRIFYDHDADLRLIQQKKVAVIGYGSQGHAHALNLRESGVEVRVGLAPSSKRIATAQAAGVTVGSCSEVAAWCDVLMMLAPDTAQAAIWRDSVGPQFREGSGKTLMFAHGFNIHYGTITPPPGIDVALIAPKAPGHRVRETYQEGGGTPALLAVQPTSTAGAHALALSYAAALGCTRAGVLETTFAEETETDLFGEQAVLCGGVSALVKAGFETLVSAGYQPEVAYFECLHELKLIVDLMYRGGLNYMRYSVSDTAEWGDYVAGNQVIGAEARAVMQRLLGDIRSGAFAKAWIAEVAAGSPRFKATRRAEQDQPIETVGARLRSMMPFLDPVNIKPGE